MAESEESLRDKWKIRGSLGVKWNWCYFRFLSGRKWITWQGFSNDFCSTFRRWTRKTSSDRGGIGRGTRDRHLVQPPVFQGEFLRLQLPQNDRRATESAKPYQFGRQNHFWSVFFCFRSIQDGVRGRHGSQTASVSWKTRGINVESADLMIILLKHWK